MKWINCEEVIFGELKALCDAHLSKAPTNRFLMMMMMMMVMMTMAWPVFGEPAKLYHKGKFLGNVTNNPLDMDSINNPIGRYGSRYSPDSINNPYGRYGSRYSIDSPNNPYSYLADSPLDDDYADDDYLVE